MPIPSLSRIRRQRRSLRQQADGGWRARALNPKSRTRRAWWWRVSLALVVAGFLGGAGVLAWASRDLPTPEGIVRRVVPQSTKIFDRTGTHLLYEVHGTERRTAVELSDIPRALIQATITAEDRSFYEHKGFRFTSMVRAILVDVLRGGKVQGGSTITQQFIKNAILTNEKSYMRKVKEIILAYQIERRFSKAEILKLYFNEIPYGSNAYGVEAAAQTFFGKPVKSLSLGESATLAAMTNAPTFYSPWGSRRDELMVRQRFILESMVDEGYITRGEAEAAKLAKLAFIPRRESITAPHFIFYIKELLAERYGDRAVEQGGLKVTTTLDFEKQMAAEAAIAASAKQNLAYNATNAALVALDARTSQVLAMVGSRNYFDDSIQGQVNVALRPRQPGSSFKPIVYATAFGKGFTPQTQLFDVDTVFHTDTKDYSPKDYDGKQRGPVSLRQALAGSLNVPAVKLLYLTGINHVLDLADGLGYSTLKDRSRFGLALVLGGAEVKLIEHTAAFAAFAREGVTKPTIAILRVEDASGAVLEEYQEDPGQKVLEPQIVRELTNILSDNQARSYIFGTSNHLTLPDRPVATKTGTTNDYRDAWTVGYTPSLVAGVWVGNSDNYEMKRGADGSVVAAPIWQSFMTAATKNQPVETFAAPEPRTTDKSVLDGGIGGERVTIDTTTGKLATDLTPPSYRVQREFRQYHTILRYVAPGDPLGPAPLDPTQDPQYAGWEAGVRRWAEAQGLSDEIPPAAYDDAHTEANLPSVSITYPTANQTVNQNPATFTVSTSAPRGVARVQYYLDDQTLGVTRVAPFSLIFSATTDWPNGFHTLRVVTFDDVENSREASTTFNLLVTPITPAVPASFSSPAASSTLVPAQFPYQVRVELAQPSLVKQVDLYATKPGEPSSWLGVVTNPSDSISFPWNAPLPGTYTLSLTFTTAAGTIPGPRTTVTVVKLP